MSSSSYATRWYVDTKASAVDVKVLQFLFVLAGLLIGAVGYAIFGTAFVLDWPFEMLVRSFKQGPPYTQSMVCSAVLLMMEITLFSVIGRDMNRVFVCALLAFWTHMHAMMSFEHTAPPEFLPNPISTYDAVGTIVVVGFLLLCVIIGMRQCYFESTKKQIADYSKDRIMPRATPGIVYSI